MISLGIDIRDNASPKLTRIAREMPNLLDDAIRTVVASHRRRLKRFMTQNAGNYRRKKSLTSSASGRLIDNPVIRRKHDHRSDRPFSGKEGGGLQNAVRFVRKGKLAYGYGFIGGAEAWMKRLHDGLFMNPRTKVVGNSVTPSMRRYFGSIGIGLKQSTKTLDMPKRPLVEDYFKANHRRMLNDVRGIVFSRYNKLNAKVGA